MSSQIVLTGDAPFAEYQASPGLNYSAMKDLLVSPLRFWHKWINPNRKKEEPTPEMQFGSALHCAVLEPSEVEKRYCCEIDQDDYPGCLVTMDDLRAWMKARNIPTTAARKQDLIDRIREKDPSALILQVIEENHARDNAGKVQFKKSDWYRIGGAANALRSEPEVANILSREGQAESWITNTDKDTGVLLKSRVDFVTAREILDLKTFSQTRGKSIDKTITDALWYEGYIRQAVFYAIVHGWPNNWHGETIFAFVESQEPHEVRLRAIRPKTAGQPNLYWQIALSEVRQMIRLYAECLDKFGDRPWRDEREIDPLVDEEIPQVAY